MERPSSSIRMVIWVVSSLMPVLFFVLRDSNLLSKDHAAIGLVNTSPTPTTNGTMPKNNGTMPKNGVIVTQQTVTMTHEVSPDMSPSMSSTPFITNTPIASDIKTPLPTPSISQVPVSPSPSQSISVNPSDTPNLHVTMSPLPSPLNDPRIVINEVGWMGTLSSSTDEWLELYNDAEYPVNISGWVLVSSDMTPNITLSGGIGAKGYFLIERTSDTTVADINADMVVSFGKGSLNNSGEQLTLRDAQGKLMDAVGSTSGWPAGDNQTKASMERIDPLQEGDLASNWSTAHNSANQAHDAEGNPILGTPKAKNSVTP